MKNIQVFAKALLEQIEVARVRQLSGLKESVDVKYTDTAKAISLFQKYVGLDQTGVPDPKTMHMIKMVAEDAKSAGQAVGQAVGGAADWLGKQASSAWSGAKNLVGQAAQGVQNFAAGAQQGAQQAMTQPTAKPKTAPDPKVLALQKDLISKGAKIKADGIMGPATQAAQKQFGGAKPAASAEKPAAEPARDPGTGELKSAAVDLNSPAMSALNQPGVAPTQGNSLSQSPNQEAEINAPAAPAANPAAGGAAMANSVAQGQAAAAPAAPAANPAAGGAAMANSVAQGQAAAAPAAAPTPATSAEIAKMTPANRAGFPDSEEDAPAFDPTWGGTKAGPDTRSKMQKILPNFLGGKSAPVAANQNATWNNSQQRAVSNKQAEAPQQASNSMPAAESRLREDPELTAMLRIAGLR
jgi:hypothetical protein